MNSMLQGASVVVSSLWFSLPASQAPALVDFGNSLPPSGLLELHERAGVGVGTALGGWTPKL